MSLWRRMRGELAGLWRSVRYDLGRRPSEGAGGPDVTSTGLSTFPGSLMEWRTATPEPGERRPRRFVAITGLCVLGLTGAIGSYVLVTRGLANAGQSDVPPPAAAPPVVVVTASSAPAVKMGGAHKKPRPTSTTITAAPPADSTQGDISGNVAHKPAPPRPRTTTPQCDCVTPPVPTPTAPSSGPATHPDPGVSSSGSTSASTDPSTGDSGSSTGRDHRPGRKHWQKTG